MKRSYGLLAVAAVVALTPTLSAADGIDDVIKARQSYYQVVKHNAGGLFAMAKGDVAYDNKLAATYAANLKLLSEMNNGSMWPAGSSKSDRKGKTRALAEIWETFPAIQDKGKAFKAATATLAGSAGEGLDALRKDIGALGASCKGCHDTYRAKDF